MVRTGVIIWIEIWVNIGTHNGIITDTRGIYRIMIGIRSNISIFSISSIITSTSLIRSSDGSGCSIRIRRRTCDLW